TSYNGLIKDINLNQQVSILNPLSQDLAVMRQTLLFGGLEAIEYNINRKNATLKLFEFGKTYAKTLTGYEEYKHLALFATGNTSDSNWNVVTSAIDFFLFKGYIDALLNRLGLKNFVTKPNDSDIFSEGIEYFVGDRKVVSF